MRTRFPSRPEIKNATDVWVVKEVNPQAMVHLTEKPVELALRALTYSSRAGEGDCRDRGSARQRPSRCGRAVPGAGRLECGAAVARRRKEPPGGEPGGRWDE